MTLTKSPPTTVPTPVMIAPARMILKEKTESKPMLEQLHGNMLRLVLGTGTGAVTQGKQRIVVQKPQQQIISLPAFMDHNSTRKIIINYSISPAAATTATTQPVQFIVKNNALPPPTFTTAAAPTPTVKTEKAQMPKANNTSTCILCDDCPDNLEALHLLQHHKAANGEAVDAAALDPSFVALLSKAGVTLEEPPVDDLLSLLKTYFATNANPGQEELRKISESVSIPMEVVRKWFVKMNSGKNVGRSCTDTVVSKKTETTNSNSEDASTQNRDTEKDNEQEESAKASTASGRTTPPTKQEHPLNLTCLRTEQLKGRTIYVTTPQTRGPVNIVSATKHLSTINTTTNRTILIPQHTYTYATTAGSATGAKTVVLNGHKLEKSLDSSSEGISAVEEQNHLYSAALIKKRRLENGVYPCDHCNKVFQNYSTLLRHEYGHSGKRPHECSVCKKAFKHKHHLNEHLRLHSGEKPYQCDKCGKRFSHSGSYSQHLNHRSPYCKDGPSSGSRSGPSKVQSESTQVLFPSLPLTSQLDSGKKESEEEEDDDDEAMCMDDIRVVHVEDGVCEIYEGYFDDDDDDDDEEEEEMAEEEPTRDEEA